VQQGSQAVGLVWRQWRCLINDLADVLCESGGAKITPSISDGRIIGVSVAFESIVPRSGGIHGLQLSLSADAKRRPPLGGCGLLA
jgi:hypothetical protein